MPINAFPGDSSWGYNPVFYHAIANSYGTPADFKPLWTSATRRASP
jgi:1,4-alpha-glucan branching enzyme